MSKYNNLYLSYCPLLKWLSVFQPEYRWPWKQIVFTREFDFHVLNPYKSYVAGIAQHISVSPFCSLEAQ